MRVEFGGLISGRNRDQMNANIFETYLIAQRLIGSNRRRVEKMDSANAIHCGNLFSG
jgi:hypothetical protein